MISQFTVKNKTTGLSATFGTDITNDYVYKDDGLDWGTASGEHSTYYYPGQVGEYISITNIKGRNLSIVGYAYYVPTSDELANNSWDDLHNIVYSKIRTKKNTLASLINPLDFLTITIGEYYIEGKPEKSIAFGNVESENNEFFCQFSVAVYCPDPMFRKVKKANVRVSGSEASWHFPLSIPSTGFVFSTLLTYDLIDVVNDGNSAAGAVITLTATGEVVNPTIDNATTGESLTIYKTLSAGEVIQIDTRPGADRGILGGIGSATLNYFKYWDFENDWIQFVAGDNLLGYSTENDANTLLAVTVQVMTAYYALEEM